MIKTFESYIIKRPPNVIIIGEEPNKGEQEQRRFHEVFKEASQEAGRKKWKNMKGSSQIL